MGAYECLANGIGFVWDHYYHGNAIANALLDSKLSGAVAPTLQDLSGPFKDFSEKHWQETLKIDSNSKFKQSGIFSVFGPHATNTVSQNLWFRIKEASNDLNLPIHCHLAQSIEEYEFTQEHYSKSPVHFLKEIGILDDIPHALLVHNILFNEDDFLQINKVKNTLCFCPFSQTIFAFQANVNQWQKHQLNWVIGTDCVASNDSMNIQKELRMLSSFPIQELSFSSDYKRSFSRDKNIEPLKNKRKEIWEDTKEFRDHNFLLKKIWSLPSTMHPQTKVGVIEPNHLANLVVWDHEHPCLWPFSSSRSFAFTDSTQAILNMMVAGKWVGDFSEYQNSLKEQSLYKHALSESKKRLTKILNII